jgi:hypothetical protein
MASEREPSIEKKKENELLLRIRYSRLAETTYREVQAPVLWANRQFVELQLPEEASGKRVRFRRKTGTAAALFTQWSFYIVPEDLAFIPLGTTRKAAPKPKRIKFTEPRPTLLVSCKHRTEPEFQKVRWELIRLEGHEVILRRPDAFGGGEIAFAKYDGTTDNLRRNDGWFFALHILERTTLAFLRTGLADFNKRWNYRSERLSSALVCLRFQEQLNKGEALEGEHHAKVLKRTKTTLTVGLPDGSSKTFSGKTGLELKHKSKGAALRWAIISEEWVFD